MAFCHRGCDFLFVGYTPSTFVIGPFDEFEFNCFKTSGLPVQSVVCVLLFGLAVSVCCFILSVILHLDFLSKSVPKLRVVMR